MKLSEDIILAIQLKQNNKEIEAPINDVAQCIRDIRETGVSEEQLKTMVANIYSRNRSSTYMNSPRYPNEDEILIYDLSDSWLDIMRDTEEHKI